MRSVISGLAAVAALCASAAVGIAQQAGYQLEPGTRIRLVTPKLPAGDRIVRVVATGGDTIAFRSELSSTIQSLPLSDVEAVEVSMGHRRHILRGAGLGLLGGAGLGGVVGLVAFQPCEPSCPHFGTHYKGTGCGYGSSDRRRFRLGSGNDDRGVQTN
jgi:hypothetical protein